MKLDSKALYEQMNEFEYDNLYDIIETPQAQPYKLERLIGLNENETHCDYLYRGYWPAVVSRKLLYDFRKSQRRLYVRVTRIYKTTQLFVNREQWWGVVTADQWLEFNRIPEEWERLEQLPDRAD